MNKGYVYAIMSSFLLSGSLMITSYLVRSLNPRMLAFMFFATVYAVTFLVLLYKEKKDYFKLIRRHWKDGIVVGGFNALAATFFFLSLETLDPATISFLARFSTVFVIIIGLFYFKEKLSRLDIAGGAIAVIGALIINLNIGTLEKFGIISAIAAAFFIALHQSSAKKFVKRTTAFKLVNLRALFSSAFLLILLAGTGSFEHFHLDIVPLFIFSGLIATTGFVLFYKSLERIEVSKAAALRTLDPFVVVIYAFFIFQTKPSIQELAGGSLIVAGVIIIMMKSSIRSLSRRAGRKIRTGTFRKPRL